MNSDDLEHRLARTPRAEPPAAWRTEILAAARSALRETADRSGVATTPERPAARPSPQPAWLAFVWAGRRWLAEASPWTVLAAGCLVVAALNQAGTWIEQRPTGPALLAVAGESATRPVSPIAVLAAARSYRADLASLATAEEDLGERSPTPAALPAAAPNDGRGTGARPEERPRTEWTPPGRTSSGSSSIRYV